MKSNIKTLIIIVTLFVTCTGFARGQAVQDGPTRWRFEESGALRCDLNGHDPFGTTRPIDFVTHGRRVILHLRLPVDDGAAPYVEGPKVQWPIFKRGVRDKSLVISGPRTRATDLPVMCVNDQPYAPAKREAYQYGGPFSDEDSIDLLSPAILYARVITEGLFGLEPLSFGSLRCRPRLPESWPHMRLKRVWLLGRYFDIEVQRSEGQLQVRVLEDGKVLYTQSGSEGTVFDIPL